MYCNFLLDLVNILFKIKKIFIYFIKNDINKLEEKIFFFIKNKSRYRNRFRPEPVSNPARCELNIAIIILQKVFKFKPSICMCLFRVPIVLNILSL